MLKIAALNTLSNYSVLVDTAVKTGYIGQSEVETLKNGEWILQYGEYEVKLTLD